MKKYFFSFLTIFSFALSFSQNYYLASPEGFGSATTGGGNVTPVMVSTYTDLKSNLTSVGSKVILVSGTITIPANQSISAIITNKSLIGLPGATLVNENQTTGAGILYLKTGSNNIIIRNLIFVGPGAYDIDGKDDLTADGATNLWVDHCEFQDGQDGNFDIKGLSDNVTVSYCKFTYLKPPVAGGSGGSNDHRFSNLVGSSATDAPTDGHYSITFQNNFWGEGVKGRMPRARNAELHILSCLFNTSVSGATAIGLGGGINNTTCYVENSYFKKVQTVYSPAPADGGTVALNYVNSLGNGSNFGTVTAPSYSTTSIPVNKVELALTDPTCGAGASLQVSGTGVISPSNCTNLAVVNQSITSQNKVQCTSVMDKKLQINLPKKTSGITEFQIFSPTGQLLVKKNYIINSVPPIIDVSELKTGFYLLSTKSGNETFSCKFYSN
jgi:pectate lyase